MNLIVRADHDGSRFIYYVVDLENPARIQHKGYYPSRKMANKAKRDIAAGRKPEITDIS